MKIEFPESYSSDILRVVVDRAGIDLVLKATSLMSGRSIAKLLESMTYGMRRSFHEHFAEVVTFSDADASGAFSTLQQIATEVVKNDSLSPGEINDLLADLPDSLPRSDSPEEMVIIRSPPITEFIPLVGSIPSVTFDLTQIIPALVALPTIARNSGLFALEEIVPHSRNSVLSAGLKLVLFGTDPVVIHKTNRTHARRCLFEFSTLLRMIDATVLSLTTGENPRTLEGRLLAMLDVQ